MPFPLSGRPDVLTLLLPMPALLGRGCYAEVEPKPPSALFKFENDGAEGGTLQVAWLPLKDRMVRHPPSASVRKWFITAVA